MYKIYIDGSVLYDPRIADDGYVVTAATVNMGLNETGSMEFTIPTTNPLYNSIQKLKSMVEVFEDDDLLFRGRVLHDERDFDNNKNVYCEGELAFMMDIIISPRSFNNTPIADVFANYVSVYNTQVEASKRFTVGTVTVTGSVTYESYDFEIMLDDINKRLIEPFGGYIRTRYANGVHYIDYLANYEHVCDQMIEFGMNLLDFNEYVSAENVYTVLIPLGKQLQDADGNYIGRVNIKSVNNNKEYVTNSAASDRFGNIWKTEIFDEIEDPTELKAAGTELLNKNLALATTITIKALDLHLVNVNAEEIKIGDGVRVFSAAHGLDEIFQCTAITYNLMEPGSSTYEFGTPQVSISRRTAQLSSNVQEIVNEPRDPFTDEEIDKMREEILKSIPTFNLLPSLYYEATMHGTTYVANGITWTTNADGSVTAKGTASSNGSGYSVTGIGTLAITIDPDKTYTLSGCPSGGGYSSYVCSCRAFTASETPSWNGGVIYRDFGSGVQIPTGYKYVYVYLWIYPNYACPSAGITFLPMLEVGTAKHSFISTTTNSAVLISDISQNATNIQSKVSSTDYTGATVVSLINQSAASVIIDAAHISLSGKQINLTSNNITISSTNFSVTNDGSIIASAGKIGGWVITSNAIYKYTNYTEGTATNDCYLKKLWASDGVTGTGWAFSVQKCRYDPSGSSHFSNYTTNFYIQNDGRIVATSFKFGAMESVQSMTSDDADVWIRHAAFISYGIEILNGTESNTPYIDFNNAIQSPTQHDSAHDHTARIINNTTDTITFYGRRISSSVTNPATLVSGTWTVTSDRRLKRQIKALSLESSKRFISALKPSSFEYKNIPGLTHHGFIYDEVEKVKPDAAWVVSNKIKDCMGNGDTYGAINITEIIPDLVAVVQSQMEEIAELKQRLSYLGY